nr:MAK10-like protein [Tanacetum cinerariifolium]
MENENHVRTLGDYSRPSHEGYRNTIELPDGNNVNDPRDFAKPVKAISLPQDVTSTSDRRLIELEKQVQHFMEAHIAPNPLVQLNKITSSCEIRSGPYDNQYCMENTKQAFVDYASSRIDEAGGKLGDSKPFNTLADLGSSVNLIPLNLFKKLKIGLLKETKDVLGLADGNPTFPLLVGRGFLATASVVIDCKKTKIAVGEGITRSIFGVKEINFGEENIPYWTTIGKRESYTPRPSTDGIGARPPYDAKKDFMNHHLPEE